jgi:negative regulator of flagellin synthesis FlgM
MANEITGLRPTALTPAQARPVANGPVSAQTRSGAEPAAADTVTLTDSGRLMQRLEAAVARAPHVDGQRIARIKEQIANGAYRVDADRLAQQVAQFEQDFGGVERSFEMTRTDSGYSWTMTTETASGTRERTVAVAYDAATQTLTRDMSLTRANGEEVSSYGTLTRTEDGYTKNFMATGASGESIYRSTETSYDAENGSVTRVVTHDGVEHDFTRTTQLARVDDGELVHKTVVDANDA